MTDVGRVRTGNEDSIICEPLESLAAAEHGLFCAVADGMGGHAAGEIASRLAVETIVAFISDTRDADVNRTWPFPYDHALSLDGNRLKAAFRLANRKLGSAVDANDTLRGMATTAAAVLFGHGAPTVAHVGDSRVYVCRDGLLHQITQDHSWVSEHVRAGVMTEKDARRHPWRNVVTRALAGGDDPEVDVADIDVRAGDRLLLCSDGLHGVVAPEQLEALVRKTKSLGDTCQALVDAANAAGGPDNITVVLLQVDVA